MPFRIERNDIVRMKTDAIVNTANPEPVCGSGTDLAVYMAAGKEELLEARRKIGRLEEGDAAITPGFALPAKYIIHTAGPVWKDGTDGVEETLTLRRCVENALDLARDNGCASIAFPLLSTGNNGFPKDLALRTMLSAFSDWLMRDGNDMSITLAVFDRESADISEKISGRLLGARDGRLEAYIDDHYVGQRFGEEYPRGQRRRRRWFEKEEVAESTAAASTASQMDPMAFGELFANYVRRDEEVSPPPGLPGAKKPAAPPPGLPGAKKPAAPPPGLPGAKPPAAPRSDDARTGAAPMGYPAAGSAPRPFKAEKKKPSLADRIRNIGDSFHTRLFRLIDERGLKDPEVYKAANLDKRLFSKIRSNPKYKPKKETALALAIALKLNIDETADLLARAGYALSPSSMTDVIVRYYIESGNYDMMDINCELYDHGEPMLGSWPDAGVSAG